MIQCWDEVTLDEISEDITVGHVGPMANQYVDIGVPFLRSLNVEPFRINTKDLKYIPREFHRSNRPITVPVAGFSVAGVPGFWLATFRRKNDVSGTRSMGCKQNKTRRGERRA